MSEIRQREKWNRSDWALTIGYLIFFPPIGIAALGRWLCKQSVWH